jgi:hypothetical protein
MTALYAVTDGNTPYAADLNQYRNLARGGVVRDVKNGYGATGDGVTDDRAAIRAAIDAAAPGDTILFPPGVYVVASIVGVIAIPLHFEGYGATLKAGANGLGGSGNAWAISFDNSGLAIDNTSIRGLKFDSANRANTPVSLGTCTNAVLEDLSFTGYTAANGYYQTDSAIRMSACTRVFVSRISVKDWEYGNTGSTTLHRVITMQSNCDYIVVDSLIVDTADQGIVLSSNSKHVTITNSVFRHLSDNGLYVLDGTTGLTVTDCVFDDTEEAVVLAGVTADGGAAMRNIVISNNRFYATTNKDIAIAGDIYGVSIVGNVFEYVTAHSSISWRTANTGVWYETNINENVMIGPSGYACIYVPSSSGMTIANNRMRVTFASATNFFIRLEGTNTDTIIRHNVMDSTGGAFAGRVRFTTTVVRCLVEGNYLGASDLLEEKAGVTFRDQVWNASGWFLGTNAQREVWGTAAPVNGTWAVGDRVWNTAPAAGGAPGWVCTTAGAPGTWKAMANVAA